MSWANSFLFAVLMCFVLLGIRTIAWLAPDHVPDMAASAFGLIAASSLGSWFFGRRAQRIEGGALGWGGGFILTLIGFALLIATGLALIFAVQVLRSL